MFAGLKLSFLEVMDSLPVFTEDKHPMKVNPLIAFVQKSHFREQTKGESEEKMEAVDDEDVDFLDEYDEYEDVETC